MSAHQLYSRRSGGQLSCYARLSHHNCTPPKPYLHHARARLSAPRAICAVSTNVQSLMMMLPVIVTTNRSVLDMLARACLVVSLLPKFAIRSDIPSITTGCSLTTVRQSKGKAICCSTPVLHVRMSEAVQTGTQQAAGTHPPKTTSLSS